MYVRSTVLCRLQLYSSIAVYLEPSHVEEELHESKDREYVKVADETTSQAVATDEACDQVDIHGQCHDLTAHVHVGRVQKIQTEIILYSAF